MADELTLQISTTFAAIPPANETVSRWLTERHAPAAVIYLANLTIEELVTNCIKYGYQNEGAHVIDIALRLSDNEMALTVTDDGRPFNPLEAPAPNTDLPVEKRPVGGLGILLLRRMSDRLDYLRANGRNHTTVRKSIHHGGG